MYNVVFAVYGRKRSLSTVLSIHIVNLTTTAMSILYSYRLQVKNLRLLRTLQDILKFFLYWCQQIGELQCLEFRVHVISIVTSMPMTLRDTFRHLQTGPLRASLGPGELRSRGPRLPSPPAGCLAPESNILRRQWSFRKYSSLYSRGKFRL